MRKKSNRKPKTITVNTRWPGIFPWSFVSGKSSKESFPIDKYPDWYIDQHERCWVKINESEENHCTSFNKLIIDLSLVPVGEIVQIGKDEVNGPYRHYRIDREYLIAIIKSKTDSEIELDIYPDLESAKVAKEKNLET